MDVVLNESQYKSLILESIKNKFEQKSEDQKKFLNKIVSTVNREFNIDLKFILTWSTTIAGLMGPVYELISENHVDLSQSELALITVGVIMTFFYNTKEPLGRILQLIRERGLISEFDDMMSKTYQLKDAFSDFISSLGVSVGNLTNVLAFTFLLSTLGIIIDVSKEGFGENEIEMVIKSILLYFGTLTTKGIAKEIIKKMIKRFKD